MQPIYVDHQTLARLAEHQIYEPNRPTDPALESLKTDVRQALDMLEKYQSRAIIMYYFEEKTISEIEKELGLNEKQIRSLIRKGLVILRHALANKAAARWRELAKARPSCPICIHEQRKAIEKMLLEKPQSQSWKAFNKHLKCVLGVSFHPPIIIKHHLKFHQRG